MTGLSLFVHFVWILADEFSFLLLSFYIPMGLHTASFYTPMGLHTASFYTPMGLHTASFYTPIGLHTASFYTPIRLHTASFSKMKISNLHGLGPRTV